MCAPYRDDLVLAAVQIEARLHIYREMGFHYVMVRLVNYLGFEALFSGELMHAEQYFAQSRTSSLPASQVETIAHAMIGLAAVAAQRGACEQAGALLSEACTMQEQSQLRLDPLSTRIRDETLLAIGLHSDL